jgi:hypothetical protein
MTTRELLRGIADELGTQYLCKCGGGEECTLIKRVIQLRAIADRIDAEDERMCECTDTWTCQTCKLLARLDAPL